MFHNIIRMLSTKSKKPFTVIIEGNIGSGKTTFLEHFQKYNDVCILSEPVEQWRNCAGHNLLADLYKNAAQNCFTFQSYVQLTMLQNHTHPTTKSIKLLERSIFSARYCFVDQMFKDSLLPAPSVSVLNEWFNYIISNFDICVDLIVYLRTSPEIAYDRVLARNRQEERSLSLNYLRNLHERHENWLHHKTAFTCPAPVLTLNANLDKSCIEEEYEKCTNLFTFSV